MKVLLLTDYYPPDKIGGVGEIVKNLFAAYRRDGHDVTVLTSGKYRESERKEGIIRTSKSLIASALINNLVLLRIIAFNKVDCIHLHQSSTTLCLPLLYLLFKRKPFIINSLQVSYISEMREIRAIEIEGIRYDPNRHEKVEKFLYAPLHVILDFIGYVFSDVVTVVSHENKVELQKTFGRILNKPITVIFNGVDYGISKDRVHGTENTSEEVWIVYAGVFRMRKRIPVLLHAFKKAAGVNPNIRLMLVGGGRGYETTLKATVDMLGIGEKTVCKGVVSNAEAVDCLNKADIFCLLSSYEGMPIALLEAMAASQPSLVSNVCGMKDIIEHRVNGFSVEVDDIESIAKAMVLLAENPELRFAIGENARKWVIKEHDWNSIAGSYLKMCR